MCAAVLHFVALFAGTMFAIVEFMDTKEVAVISLSWMIGKDTAHWPPYRSSTRLTTAVKLQEAPCDSWTMYSVRVMYKSGKFCD